MKKIISYISKIIDDIKRYKTQKRQKQIEENVTRLFQATEHNGSMWLKYNDSLVAPFYLITANNSTSEIVALLKTLRELRLKEENEKKRH